MLESTWRLELHATVPWQGESCSCVRFTTKHLVRHTIQQRCGNRLTQRLKRTQDAQCEVPNMASKAFQIPHVK